MDSITGSVFSFGSEGSCGISTTFIGSSDISMISETIGSGFALKLEGKIN